MLRLLLVGFAFILAASPQSVQQSGDAAFRKLVDEIAAQRQAAGEEKEDTQRLALERLDQVLREVPAAAPSGGDRLAALQRRVQQLAGTQPGLGENYRVLTIAMGDGNRLAAIALAVNFSLSGPSAVRIYTPQGAGSGAESWKLAARIDRFNHTEFFDEYLEVVAMNPAAGVFVTVTGRTDERKTGMFMAWRLLGSELQSLWTSDLLERSSYELKGNQFSVEFCGEPDEDKPGVCRKMQRERYAWEAGWRRVAQEDVTPKTSS